MSDPAADRRSIGFVARLALPGGQPATLTLRPGNRADAQVWMRDVQPSVAEDPDRCDRAWDWSARIGAASIFRSLRWQMEYLVASSVSAITGAPVLIGIFVGFARVPFIADPMRDSLVIWHLAAAPRRYLARHFGEGTEPRGIGTALVDAATTRTFQTGIDGRVVAHAPVDGGVKLAGWLARKVGMRHLSPSRDLPRFNYFSRNDGRWFYHDIDSAVASSRALDRWR